MFSNPGEVVDVVAPVVTTDGRIMMMREPAIERDSGLLLAKYWQSASSISFLVLATSEVFKDGGRLKVRTVVELPRTK